MHGRQSHYLHSDYKDIEMFLKQEHDRNSLHSDLIQGVSHSFYKIKIHKPFSHAYPGRRIQSALRICSFDRGPPLMLSICATG